MFPTFRFASVYLVYTGTVENCSKARLKPPKKLCAAAYTCEVEKERKRVIFLSSDSIGSVATATIFVNFLATESVHITLKI